MEFSNIEAIRNALLAGDAARVILEPIQAGGGIRVASNEYLINTRELCREYGILLVYCA